MKIFYIRGRELFHYFGLSKQLNILQSTQLSIFKCCLSTETLQICLGLCYSGVGSRDGMMMQVRLDSASFKIFKAKETISTSL